MTIALKFTFSSAIKCLRNADKPELLCDRAELGHDEWSIKYFQQIDLMKERKGAWPSRHEIGSIGLTNGLPTMDTRITQVTAFNSANTLVEAILEKIANAESRKGINRVLKNYQSIKYFRTSLKKRGRRLDLTKTMKNESQSTREQL